MTWYLRYMEHIIDQDQRSFRCRVSTSTTISPQVSLNTKASTEITPLTTASDDILDLVPVGECFTLPDDEIKVEENPLSPRSQRRCVMEQAGGNELEQNLVHKLLPTASTQLGNMPPEVVAGGEVQIEQNPLSPRSQLQKRVAEEWSKSDTSICTDYEE